MRPRTIATMVFVCVAILTQYLAYQRYLIAVNDELDKVARELNAVKERLQTSLTYSLSACKTLAFLVKNYGIPSDFDSVAIEILESNRYIDALELTTGGMITHVYPLKGNEAAIGYNILEDSARNQEAFKAIEKNEIFFAGPFELKQGGLAVVGRLPIKKDGKFLGFSAALIKLETLLKASGLDPDNSDEFYYQLSKINPATLEEEFFLPLADLPQSRRAISVEVADGEWRLLVAPKNSNIFVSNALGFSVLGFLLSLTAGAFTWYLTRQPEKLKRLVEIKTYALAASEKYFRSLIEKSSDAIVLLNESGKVIYQSSSTEKISGYTPTEVSLLNTQDLIHPEDVSKYIDTFDHLVERDGTTIYLTQRIRHKRGYYIWIECTFTNLLRDPDIRAIVCNYHDITDRKEAEQAILLEKNFSDSIINCLPGIFYLYNSHGKFIRWNSNFEKISGYAAHDISQMHPLDFFPDDEKDLLKERIESVFTTGFADVTAHFYTKDKRHIPYYFNGMKVSFYGIDYLIGVGIDITDRVRAENELRKQNIEIQELTAYIERVREEERTRISREIHDELGQQLTGLKMDVSWIRKKTNNESSSVAEKFSEMTGLIDEAMKTVRRIASELRPGILDDLGLIPAIEWQTREFEKRTGIKCNLHTLLNDLDVERELSTNIFRIYQEALTNVARHANASSVETTIENTDGNIRLTVRDNGDGFDSSVANGKNSLGLTGMRERARLFNGNVTIEGKGLKGTVVTMNVPLKK